MRQGHRRVVLVIPTGGGKTRIGSEVVRQAVARGSRVVWLAHRTELIDQTAATLHEYGLEVGVVAASSVWPARPTAPVQVCSIQTLLARGARPPAELIVWDECHHASDAAEEWASLLQAYDGVHMLGLTATPERGDGAGLAPLFDGLVVGVTVRQLTELGHLVPCEVMRPATLLEPNHIAMHPLEAYMRAAAGTQGFLFARTVAEAKDYAETFTAAGIRAECIHGGTKADDRSVALDLFRRGIVRMLCNVYIFTEGTDLPQAQTCILARGASTPGIYLQMVGRVLRPHASKQNAILIDLRGISHIHGMPEDERVYQLEGRGMAVASASCPVCSTPLVSYPCESCGYMPAAGDGDKPQTIEDGVDLVRYARKIAESPAQRWQTCVRWVRAAVLKQHKVASVRHKWRAVYGEELPRDWLRQAEAIVNGHAIDRGMP
jgi:superfamily II DNA or RNA helicase